MQVPLSTDQDIAINGPTPSASDGRRSARDILQLIENTSSKDTSHATTGTDKLLLIHYIQIFI